MRLAIIDTDNSVMLAWDSAMVARTVLSNKIAALAAEPVKDAILDAVATNGRRRRHAADALDQMLHDHLAELVDRALRELQRETVRL